MSDRSQETIMRTPEGDGRAGSAAPTPRIDVQGLFGAGREAILVNGETEYRLRLTSTGKLILTK